MLKTSSLAKWGVAALLLSSLSSCEDILEQYFPKPNPTPPTIPTFPPLGQDIAFYALSGGNKLDGYNTSNAATRTSSVAITGLGSGETLLAIDFRPATGQLYGISSASRLYVINQNTGAARAIGSGAFTPALGGNLVGFDFNPTVDRIRLVTSTGQNLRLNPETGAVAATDGSLNGAAGATITGSAYTNNTNGVSTTVLYDLDPASDQLFRQDPPNDGTLVPVGNLNLNISGNGGFDIDAKTGTALGLYTVSGTPTLFSVDLETGAARPLAEYAANMNYSGIAIPTQLVAYMLSTQRDIRGREQFNSLHIFHPTGMTASSSRQISGLVDLFEEVNAIDFRPATGQLYLLTRDSRLYTINPANAQATLVATLSIPLGGDAISGRFAYAFDFNPVTDRIQIVSNTGQNLRVNPNDGVAVTEAPINPGGLNVQGLAYSNSFAGATTTSLYVTAARTRALDSYTTLYVQNSANEDPFSEIAPMNIALGYFDIGGTTNTAYGFSTSESARKLYTLNLATGATSPLLEFSGPNVYGFAVGLGF